MECAVYISRRVLSDGGELLLGRDEEAPLEGEVEQRKEVAAQRVLLEQVKRAWEEVSCGRLKVADVAAAEALVRTLKSVKAAGRGMFIILSRLRLLRMKSVDINYCDF